MCAIIQYTYHTDSTVTLAAKLNKWGERKRTILIVFCFKYFMSDCRLHLKYILAHMKSIHILQVNFFIWGFLHWLLWKADSCPALYFSLPLNSGLCLCSKVYRLNTQSFCTFFFFFFFPPVKFSAAHLSFHPFPWLEAGVGGHRQSPARKIQPTLNILRTFKWSSWMIDHRIEEERERERRKKNTLQPEAPLMTSSCPSSALCPYLEGERGVYGPQGKFIRSTLCLSLTCVLTEVIMCMHEHLEMFSKTFRNALCTVVKSTSLLYTLSVNIL